MDGHVLYYYGMLRLLSSQLRAARVARASVCGAFWKRVVPSGFLPPYLDVAGCIWTTCLPLPLAMCSTPYLR